MHSFSSFLIALYFYIVRSDSVMLLISLLPIWAFKPTAFSMLCLVAAAVSQLVRLQNNFSLNPVNCELAFLATPNELSVGMPLIPAYCDLMRWDFV